MSLDADKRDAVAPVELPWRNVPEWIGKTPDSKVPKAVRMRVFNRWGGRCYLTGAKIKLGDKWELEHVKSLRSALPGEPHLNRETNLRPVLRGPHKAKTAKENTAGAKADRTWLKHNGQWETSGRKIPAHVDPWGKKRRKSAGGTR